MFYYPEVLRRRTGCFGTIWLAATCHSRLLRREYLGVDVARTSAAVLSFVIGRSGWEAPPPPPGAPPPRCSLYLGALLQLGLARVYGRQCNHLLEEVSLILERLNRARRPLVEIDVSPSCRPNLLPDSRALMEELEAAPDPFFGVMGVSLPQELKEAPDPFFGVMGVSLPQVEELLPPEEMEAPPERPLVATPESITLREPELPRILPEPPEEELPEVTPRELQLLLEAEEEAPELELPLPPRPAPPEAPPLSPVPLPPLAEAPPTPAVAPPTPAEAPPPRRRPRPLWDPQSQLGAGLLRAWLSDQWGECRVREPVELRRRRRLRELLSEPSAGPLPPALQRLWALCARPRPRPRPPEEEPITELPSEVEVLREALEPSLPPPTSEISLEPLEEEPSVPFPAAPPPEVLPELPEAPPIDLRRLILDHAQAPEGAELGAILGPDWPRPRVAQAFALCLELCASHWLKLEQPRPYGPIRIRLRPQRQ